MQGVGIPGQFPVHPQHPPPFPRKPGVAGRIGAPGFRRFVQRPVHFDHEANRRDREIDRQSGDRVLAPDRIAELAKPAQYGPGLPFGSGGLAPQLPGAGDVLAFAHDWNINGTLLAWQGAWRCSRACSCVPSPRVPVCPHPYSLSPGPSPASGRGGRVWRGEGLSARSVIFPSPVHGRGVGGEGGERAEWGP